ncbi:MAG: hypothetical protein LHV68_01665 [Elusimicrobia bacterium]|nr:hypothetical protein [Candidatus Liberimonas magnetica]
MIAKGLVLIYVSLLLVLNAGYLFSSGFLVEPSVIKAKWVMPGRSFEVIGSSVSKSFLEVKNTGIMESRFKIELVSCKSYGVEPSSGYQDIEEDALIKWFHIKNIELTVEPKSSGYFNSFYINIPKKKEFYGKRFQTLIKVTQPPDRGGNMALEVIIPLYIETGKMQ